MLERELFDHSTICIEKCVYKSYMISVKGGFGIK